MQTIQSLPQHLRGELYNNFISDAFTSDGFISDDFSSDIKISHPIKTDFIFNTHDDLIRIIDTCMFLAVDLPIELFQYIELHPDAILNSIDRYNANVLSGVIEESFFVTTEEYRALKLFAENILSNTINDDCMYAIKNGSVVLLDYFIRLEKNKAGTYYTPLNIYNGTLKGVPLEIQEQKLPINELNGTPPFWACPISNLYRCRNHILLDWAVKYGHIPIINYLLSLHWIHELFPTQSLQYSEQTIAQELYTMAAKYGQLPLLKYFRETLHLQWDTNVVQTALSYQHNDCLQYALENNAPIPQYAIGLAVKHSSIDALRLLVEVGKVTPTKDDTLYASQYGTVEQLAYIHEQNVEWHHHAVNFAARFKKYACMEYGMNNGASYDIVIVTLAREPYSYEIDRWIAERIRLY